MLVYIFNESIKLELIYSLSLVRTPTIFKAKGKKKRKNDRTVGGSIFKMYGPYRKQNESAHELERQTLS